MIAHLGDLWQRLPDFRFGQVLKVAVGDPTVRHPSELTDAAIVSGVAAALRDVPMGSPPPGPYWNTETETGRTFLNGLPRDPGRIPSFLSALERAWNLNSDLSLGELLDCVLDAGGVAENEFSSRLLLIEDGQMLRLLKAGGEEITP